MQSSKFLLTLNFAAVLVLCVSAASCDTVAVVTEAPTVIPTTTAKIGVTEGPITTTTTEATTTVVVDTQPTDTVPDVATQSAVVTEPTVVTEAVTEATTPPAIINAKQRIAQRLEQTKIRNAERKDNAELIKLRNAEKRAKTKYSAIAGTYKTAEEELKAAENAVLSKQREIEEKKKARSNTA